MTTELGRILYGSGGRWWRTSTVVNLGASTVVRVKEDPEPDPNFRPRPAGFTARIEPVDPKVWEGDGA